MGKAPEILDDSQFRALVNARAGSLLDIAQRVSAVSPGELDAALLLLTRPLVAIVHSQSSQLEELLDAYGALRNERWRGFRSIVAAMKLFSKVHYSLLHLTYATPNYHLLKVEGDLASALLNARRLTAGVLHTASRRLMESARPLLLEPRAVEVCEERLPEGMLAEDCPLRHVVDVAGTVARLATAFLNLAEDANALGSQTWCRTEERRTEDLPEETELRRLAEDYHNLQALYDTHVARTDAERSDPDLPSLRGHASVVYHLLDIATELTHYRERHVVNVVPAQEPVPLLASQPDYIVPEHLESVLRDCLLPFTSRYVSSGRALAQHLLRRYAEEGEITVPVPRYRGFHVRPSTLVARVAYHYGSPVSMTLEDETYDASSPLELFRANELINAKKRRWLAQEIAGLVDASDERLSKDLVRSVRMVLLRLAEEAKVVVYEQPLPPIEGKIREGQPVLSFVVEAIARFQALGKIDISTPVTAVFRGDRRVLADLHLLATNGYGEDAYGNNVALPDALRYLRR